VVLLKEMKFNLSTNINRNNFDDETCQMMLLKYQEIFEFCNGFNKIFGQQVTVVTMATTVMATLMVR
jgi:hypothetical protein